MLQYPFVSRAFFAAGAIVASLIGMNHPGARQAVPPAPAPAPSPESTEEAGPAPATEPEPGPSPTPAPDCLTRPLDAAERDTLVRLAWRTLSGHLTGNPIKDADLEAYSLTPCLQVPRGLFVSLKKGEQVRGLQGEIEATRPLYQQVIVFTRRAATRDPRFVPVTERDLGSLIIELSIIHERRRVQGPGDIRLETEGVFLEKWGRRALFLPGVAQSQGWSAEKTLEQLCAQAALPKGSWSESARIEAFTTEVASGGPPPVTTTPSAEPSATPAATPGP
jgi:AmmeMemoRadiSam system protein A